MLSRETVARIKGAVTALFARARARVLGVRPVHEIRIGVTHSPLGVREDLSIPGLFNASASAEGFRPSAPVRAALVRVAEGYLDAHEKLAQVQVVHAVQSWLADAANKGVATDAKTVLGGEIAELMGQVTANVKRIVETEATRARNVGTLDVVTKIAAVSGVADPYVFFAGPNDEHTCEECKRLFFMPDGVTPRVWRLSQVGHAYHKRGDAEPKVGGCHPHCRHTMVYLAQNYGFEHGRVTFVAQGHDEHAAQQAAGG